MRTLDSAPPPPSGPFHYGELAVQSRAGVRARAARVGEIIAPAISPPFAAFLRSARVAAVGAPDREGRVWATMLVAAPGFLRAGRDTLRVRAEPAVADALYATLTRRTTDGDGPSPPVGLTAIDFETRRRVRVNGTLASDDENADESVLGFSVTVAEAYGNCPKYIQARTPLIAPSTPGPARGLATHAATAVEERDALTESQRACLGLADTAFLASVGPHGRADASHRGGPPGFLAVAGPRHVLLPDYAGNAMFNTLGNLAVDPRVGLVVPEFATGRLLQFSGTASIDWRPEAAAAFAGAERVVVLTIERVREVAGALPAEWSMPVASPFTPARALTGPDS